MFALCSEEHSNGTKDDLKYPFGQGQEALYLSRIDPGKRQEVQVLSLPFISFWQLQLG